MRDRLCRRLSAPRRIGCPYSLVGLIAAPGFDPSGWLPGEVMAKFFQAGAPRQPDASMNGTRWCAAAGAVQGAKPAVWRPFAGCLPQIPVEKSISEPFLANGTGLARAATLSW